MSAGEAILNLLFPPKCAFCGALMEEPADGLCPACRAEEIGEEEGTWHT